MKKVNVYIDGYNFYHATKDNPSANINFKELIESLLYEKQEINKIYYFSAFATWKIDDFKKHKKYVENLESVGIKVKMAHFKKKTIKCKNCDISWKTHEEKETDVEIALQMLEDYYENDFDIAFILSGDSDLVPPIRKIKEKDKNKQIVAVISKNRQYTSRDIMDKCDGTRILENKTIKKYLFK